MHKRKITLLIIFMLAIQLIHANSNASKTFTNETTSGKVKSALLSSYEYVQQKAAHASSWFQHRINALRGKNEAINEHPEELLAAGKK